MDGIHWNNAVNETVTLENVGDFVYYRGKVTAMISADTGRFTMSGKIAASGSIMSMSNENPDDTALTFDCEFIAMFMGCTALTTAPELPATTLTKYCYALIFQGCTSLTTAPEILPATTMAEGCYRMMFYGCTSLTTAPIIMATAITTNCFVGMFQSSALESVTVYVVTWDTSAASDWLSGVAATGVVKCPSDSTIPTRSASGVPTGWTKESITTE